MKSTVRCIGWSALGLAMLAACGGHGGPSGGGELCGLTPTNGHVEVALSGGSRLAHYAATEVSADWDRFIFATGVLRRRADVILTGSGHVEVVTGSY